MLEGRCVFPATDYAGPQERRLTHFLGGFHQAKVPVRAHNFRDNHRDQPLDASWVVPRYGDSEERHRSFKEKYELPFQMIADPDGRVSKAYEASKKGLIRPRITYVIDKAGVIRAAFRHDVAIGRHLTDTIALSRQSRERLHCNLSRATGDHLPILTAARRVVICRARRVGLAGVLGSVPFALARTAGRVDRKL
jgi:hypothetical protein